MNLKRIKEAVISDGFFTDKEPFYLDNYEEYFNNLRGKKISLLEIGIGNGGSLLMWAKYFKDALIYGIDMKKALPQAFKEYVNSKGYSSSIKTVLGFEIPGDNIPLVARQHLFHEMLGNIMFDVILDDGAHTYTHTKGAFEVLFFDYLKPGGLYIIEDWGTTYFPGWPDGSFNGEDGMAKIIKELYDEVALVDRLKGQKKSIQGVTSLISSVTIKLGQIWVTKNIVQNSLTEKV